MGESEELAYSQFSSFRELEQCIQEVPGSTSSSAQPSIFTPNCRLPWKKQVTRLYFTTTLPPRKAIKSFKVRAT